MKFVDLQEFRQEGYLQEVNRLFFHPLGMALMFIQMENGQVYFQGIVDEREDPEGVSFDPPPDAVLAQKIQLELAAARERRWQTLGYGIQSPGPYIT